MILNRRSLLTALALAPAAAGASRPALARQADAAAAVLTEVFAATAPVALAAAVVGPQGVTWSDARGLRRAGHADPVGPGDRWHLGSNTKAMTAAVFARLVEQGRARWGMPLAEAFPDLTVDPAWNGATLDDFMRHRAGLADAAVMGPAWLMSARADPRSLPEQRRAIVAAALAAPRPGTPGQFAYGNANYVLVGAAIERIAGAAWEEVLRAELFAPLGMESGGFGPPLAADGSSDNAWGHRDTGGRKTAMAPDHPGADNPRALGPAGTAHMTLDDYGRFLAAMMGGRPDWLGSDSLRRLTNPPADPSPPAYACGWGVRQQPWGGRGGPGPVLGHDGSNTMWHCSAMVAPERGLALVAVSNEGAAGRGACQTLLQRLVPIATA